MASKANKKLRRLKKSKLKKQEDAMKENIHKYVGSIKNNKNKIKKMKRSTLEKQLADNANCLNASTSVTSHTNGNNTDNLSQYRLSHEPEEHWQLKLEFLMAHRNSFDEDRLLCLAQIYVNTHLLGCRYPQAVMDKIKALSEGLGTRYKDYRRNKLVRTFVTASDAAHSKVCRLPLSIPKKDTETIPPAPKKQKVIATPSMEDSCSQNNSIALCNNEMHGDEDSNQSKNYTDENKSNKNEYDEKINQKKISAYHRHMNNKKNKFSWFVVFGFGKHAPGKMLRKSCKRFNAVLNFALTPDGKISVMINRTTIATVGNGGCKEANISDELKYAASCAALNTLSKSCYMLQVKQINLNFVDLLQEAVQLDDILKSDGILNALQTAGFDVPIEEENLGSRMLKKMGWTGGGLGKTRSGIEEPVKPYFNGNRRSGIGYSNAKNHIDKAFKNAFRSVLRTFRSGKYHPQCPEQKYRLVLAASLTKEQRATVHSIALSCRLTSKSYGVEPNRYLVLWRKYKPHGMVLAGLEGDYRYTVFEPGQYPIWN